MTKSPDVRSRKWCITLNNYTNDEYNCLVTESQQKNWKYIFGKEVGKNNGTPHIQGYIESKEAIRMSTLNRLWPRAHLEKAKGNEKQNFEYCSKDNNYTSNIIIKKKLTMKEFIDIEKEKIIMKNYDKYLNLCKEVYINSEKQPMPYEIYKEQYLERNRTK